MLTATAVERSSRAEHPPGDAAPPIVGLEHEFVVLAAEAIVDFRHVIHGLRLGQPNLDPADPYSYRLPSGTALTCDGAEAEIALPPTAVGRGFALEIARRADRERDALVARLSGRMRVEGYSTHISVSVPDALTKRVCRTYATTFAPAMMLLMDRRESAGLLIRPRPGRVELGGDYLAGDQLGAAIAFAVASVLTCADLARRETRDGLPSDLDVRVDPAVDRFGWYVDRTAFGGDLYVDARSASLRTVDGGRVSAQAHLEDCWRLARHAIEDVASAAEVALVDEAVRGERVLPTERVTGARVSPLTEEAPSATGPYGEALLVRARPSFDLAPVMLTWQLVVFLVVDRRRRRRAFAAVPGRDLGTFLARLNAGALDVDIDRFLRGRHRARRLRSWTEIEAPGLYGAMGRRIDLIHPEFSFDGEPMTNLASRAVG